MRFLSEEDRRVLSERFERELTSPVRVVLFSEPVSGLYVPGRRTCVSCRETEALMTEVAELSDSIRLEILNVREQPDVAAEWEASLTPAIAVCGEDDAGVRFLGLPAGYEFFSFVETLASAAAGDGHGLLPETVEKLEALDQDLDIKVFSTPT